jgi:hypothetical protein
MYKITFVTIAFGAVLLNISAAPAACRKYSIWNYPYPQPRCGVAARGKAPKYTSYYVEIGMPPSDTTIPLPVLDPLVPEAKDLDTRTPEEIQDQVDHDVAVQMHKTDINKLMIILHAVEGNEQ